MYKNSFKRASCQQNTLAITKVQLTCMLCSYVHLKHVLIPFVFELSIQCSDVIKIKCKIKIFKFCWIKFVKFFSARSKSFNFFQSQDLINQFTT